MALIKCHECGNSVSSEAVVCPNCGAEPRIPSETTGTFWKVIIIAGICYALFNITGNESTFWGLAVVAGFFYALSKIANMDKKPAIVLAPTAKVASPESPSAQDIKRAAIAALKIEEATWTAKFNFMELNISLKNTGDRNIKDFEITCELFSKSGTAIDKSQKIIYEIIEAGETWSIKEFDMGVIHSQAVKARFQITDLVVI